MNRLVVENLQPGSPEEAIEGLRFQGSSQEDREKMPNVFGEAAYRLFQLPTYKTTWISMISSLTTFFRPNKKYQIGAGELSRLKQPVLYIWGENDPFGDLAFARRAAESTPNAKLVEMAAGHLPLFDRPEECGRAIQEFLSNRTGFSQPTTTNHP